MASAELGGDSDELAFQPLDRELAQMVFEPSVEALPGDEAGTREIDIEETKDAAAGKGAGEVLERSQPARHIAGAGNRADRGSRDDVRYQAGGDQGLQDADMGPPAGCAAAKCDANRRFSHDAHGFKPRWRVLAIPGRCTAMLGGWNRLGRVQRSIR